MRPCLMRLGNCSLCLRLKITLPYPTTYTITLTNKCYMSVQKKNGFELSSSRFREHLSSEVYFKEAVYTLSNVQWMLIIVVLILQRHLVVPPSEWLSSLFPASVVTMVFGLYLPSPWNFLFISGAFHPTKYANSKFWVFHMRNGTVFPGWLVQPVPGHQVPRFFHEKKIADRPFVLALELLNNSIVETNNVSCEDDGIMFIRVATCSSYIHRNLKGVCDYIKDTIHVSLRVTFLCRGKLFTSVVMSTWRITYMQFCTAY